MRARIQDEVYSSLVCSLGVWLPNPETQPGMWTHQLHVRIPGLASSVLSDYDELHSGIGSVTIAG